MNWKSLLVLLPLGFLLTCVPAPSKENTLEVTGKVVDLFEGGENDVVIQLNNDRSFYYINRGLESGLTLEELKEKLLNQQVLLKCPDMWTPLDPHNVMHHLYHHV